MISEIEQETLDIDWFFTTGKKIGFVASGGGKVPVSIAEKSLEEIEFLSVYFRSLPTISNSFTDDTNLKILITPGTNRERYLRDFNKLTEKGLFSFDKAVSNRFSDTNYLLVTKPNNPLMLSDLPIEISKILIQTKIEIEKINEILDVTYIS